MSRPRPAGPNRNDSDQTGVTDRVGSFVTARRSLGEVVSRIFDKVKGFPKVPRLGSVLFTSGLPSVIGNFVVIPLSLSTTLFFTLGEDCTLSNSQPRPR